MEGNLTAVNLRDYYQSLGKKEKGELLKKIMEECGMGYSTIQSKIAGRLPFRPLELIAINNILGDRI